MHNRSPENFIYFGERSYLRTPNLVLDAAYVSESPSTARLPGGAAVTCSPFYSLPLQASLSWFASEPSESIFRVWEALLRLTRSFRRTSCTYCASLGPGTGLQDLFGPLGAAMPRCRCRDFILVEARYHLQHLLLCRGGRDNGCSCSFKCQRR